MTEAEAFIRRFHLAPSVREVFTCGCCYWFAYILCGRFPDESRLMYDPVANHFAAEIRGKPYDITGDVTGQYDLIPWDSLDDEAHRSRIVRDCILF